MIPVVLQGDPPDELNRLLQQNRLWPPATTLPQQGLYLLAEPSGLSLRLVGEKGAVQVDFISGAAQYRRTKGGGELIAKAVNHTSRPKVWDATGGLGRDAFVLASLGLEVQIFEQNPVVACLLADGLNRAALHPDTADIAARTHLNVGNAAELLIPFAQSHGRPDVVYLDPMYPERQKSAAVKKEMAYFHQLVGTNQDDAALLAAAKAVAQKRVVVKRPRLGVFLNQEPPAYQYSGKSTRFDVYLPTHPT